MVLYTNFNGEQKISFTRKTMLLKLTRKKPQSNAICGELLIDNRWFCSTLERTDVAIPAGFYPVTLTMSPRFGEVLPLIGNVVGRTGIRIHAGNYPRDTAGCILVGVASTGDADASSAGTTNSGKNSIPPQPRLLSSRRTLNKLCEILLTNYNDRKTKRYEPVYIEIINPDPYPLYDVPCPLEQRMHYIEGQRAAREYNLAHPDELAAA